MESSMTGMTHQRSAAYDNAAVIQPGSDSSAARLFLACGTVAGPLFVAVGAIQALTVPGFDLTRHALSMLEVGPYGAVQVANFLVSGALLVVFGVGLRNVLRARPAGAIAPILVAVCGLGFMGGAFFHPDPGLGFPVGTPDVIPSGMSTYALLHMVFGSIAFLALIGACFMLARPFAASHHNGMATRLRLAGATFTIGLVESFGGGPLGSLVLFVTAAVALIAVAVAAAQLRAEQATVRA